MTKPMVERKKMMTSCKFILDACQSQNRKKARKEGSRRDSQRSRSAPKERTSRTRRKEEGKEGKEQERGQSIEDVASQKDDVLPGLIVHT